ncbi:hypothetical protein XENOCAPTIV_025610 [Xenoophorus captivus]|uniref:Uncharacterized protein n=1 Tax=Xenoophorus captivus TaxID=1517983 RepID=A0ABV0RV88_9TELE
MCSAPYGRKKRPRSAGSIFPISKGTQAEPERRESTEAAVDDSRMVGRKNTVFAVLSGDVHNGDAQVHVPAGEPRVDFRMDESSDVPILEDRSSSPIDYPQDSWLVGTDIENIERC